MKNILKTSFLILIIISIISCRKNPGSASWDVDVAAPLINSSLTINNILADSLLQVNPDSSINIVYNNTLYSFYIDSLFVIPDTIKQINYSFPINWPNAYPGFPLLNNTDNKILNLGSALITKIIIKKGYVNLKISSTFAGQILCKYEIPSASFNGNQLELTDLVPAASSTTPANYYRKVDISGYTFNLTGPNGNSANILTSIIHAWVDPDGDSVDLNMNDSLIILATFDSLEIEYAKGYFGTQAVESGIKSADFDLFNKITSGSLSLEDMHLVLSISNGFGVDASLLIHEIKSVHSSTGNTVMLNSPFIGSLINISRAQETYNPADPVNPTDYSLNFDNSNFKQLIENLPDKIEYSIDVTTDPLGNISCGNDFAYNQYGFKADLNLEIPLSVIATNLTLTDTLDFNLDRPAEDIVNSGILTLIADNGFPFSASAQMYLLDENYQITDSLISVNNTILSAPLDAQDKAIGKKKSKIIIPVSGNRLDNIYDAKKIILTVKFNTANQGHYIKIYSDYAIDMILTADFNMTVNGN
jgi:hypothetical protein